MEVVETEEGYDLEFRLPFTEKGVVQPLQRGDGQSCRSEEQGTGERSSFPGCCGTTHRVKRSLKKDCFEFPSG